MGGIRGCSSQYTYKEQKMKVVSIEVNDKKDRDSMIIALAHTEHKVWVEEDVYDHTISVCFEIKQNEVRNIKE